MFLLVADRRAGAGWSPRSDEAARSAIKVKLQTLNDKVENGF
jgi:hypothetical protein